MTQDELLQLAWGAAWSAPNNKQPSGTYIGTISRGGRDYEFYEVANGQYQYISHATGGGKY